MTDGESRPPGAPAADAVLPHLQCSHCANVATRAQLVVVRDGNEICTRCGWKIVEEKDGNLGTAHLIEVGEVEKLFRCTSCERTSHEDRMFVAITPETITVAESVPIETAVLDRAISMAASQGETIKVCLHCGTIGSIEAYDPNSGHGGLSIGDRGAKFEDGSEVEFQVEGSAEALWATISDYIESTGESSPPFTASLILANYGQNVIDYLLQSEPAALWLEVQAMDVHGPIKERGEQWFREVAVYIKKEVNGFAPGYVEFDESELPDDDGAESGDDGVDQQAAQQSNAFFQGTKIGDAIMTLVGAFANLFQRSQPLPVQQYAVPVSEEMWARTMEASRVEAERRAPCRVVNIGNWLLIPREDFINITCENDVDEVGNPIGRRTITVTYWSHVAAEEKRRVAVSELTVDDPNMADVAMKDVYAQLVRPTVMEAQASGAVEMMARMQRGFDPRKPAGQERGPVGY